MTEAITSFSGRHRFLSNFWPAHVMFAHVVFPTVEHAYQAAKSDKPADHIRICGLLTAGQAKRAGRMLKARSDFAAMKLFSMSDLIRQKFENPHLRTFLLATGDAVLVEGNTWGDMYWGTCDGVGENHLGKILMKVRADLRRVKHADL